MLEKGNTVDFGNLGRSTGGKTPNSVCSIHPPPAPSRPPKCNFCDAPTTYCCTKCFHTPYCNNNKCWKADQNLHSKQCGSHISYKLNRDLGLSSGTKAAEKGQEKNGEAPAYEFVTHISKGSVVFNEDESKIVFPSLPDGYRNITINGDKPAKWYKMVCFGCHMHFFLKEDTYLCQFCGILRCGPKCEDKYHRSRECNVLRRCHKPNLSAYKNATMKEYLNFYLDICVLRVLSEYGSGVTVPQVAAKWKTFLLYASTKRFKSVGKTDQDPYDGIQYMSFLSKSVETMKFSLAYARYNREIVKLVCKIMIVFWEEFESSPGIISRIFFMERHLMTQSYCKPNVAVSAVFCEIGGVRTPMWCFTTTKDIKASPKRKIKLTFDFSSGRRFMPLPLRMINLREKGLPCFDCEIGNGGICQDPSDGDTDSGSIRCLKCYRGLYKEQYPEGIGMFMEGFPKRWSEKYEEEMDWKCDLCDDKQPFRFILQVNRRLENCYDTLLRKSRRGNFIKDAVNFVDYYENSYLHSTNGVILRAKYDVLVACRAKHFTECNLNKYGSPKMDDYRKRKVEMKYPLKDEELRLFPIQWNDDELLMTYKRETYAGACQEYLQAINYKRNMTVLDYSPDLIFVTMENQNAHLLLTCYEFFMHWTLDSGLKINYAMKFTVDAVRDWNIHVSCVSFSSFRLHPLLKWPKKLIVMTRLMSGNQGKDPLFIAKLVLKSMGICVAELTMGREKNKVSSISKNKQKHELCYSCWPSYPPGTRPCCKISS